MCWRRTTGTCIPCCCASGCRRRAGVRARYAARLGRRGAFRGDHVTRSAAICDASSSRMPAVASSLISSSDLHRLDVVRRAPGVFALEPLAVLRLRSASRVFRFKRQGFLTAHRFHRGDVLAQVSEIRAAGGALFVQSLQRRGDGFRSPSTLKVPARCDPTAGRDRGCSRRLRWHRSARAGRCPA